LFLFYRQRAAHQSQGLPRNWLNANRFLKTENFQTGSAPAIWCSRLLNEAAYAAEKLK